MATYTVVVVMLFLAHNYLKNQTLALDSKKVTFLMNQNENIKLILPGKVNHIKILGISIYPDVTDLVASIFSPGFRKDVIGWANFPPGCPFLPSRCFAFFKRTQMIYARYVKVAPEKPQTGRVKLNILPATGEAKFSLD